MFVSYIKLEPILSRVTCIIEPSNSDSLFILEVILCWVEYNYGLIFREMCDESMTHSASSASSLDSHALSESSQSQGVRWEEQQKVLAVEQLCGVFRVDLGHMRSLRLFFRCDAKAATLHNVLHLNP